MVELSKVKMKTFIFPLQERLIVLECTGVEWSMVEYSQVKQRIIGNLKLSEVLHGLVEWSKV